MKSITLDYQEEIFKEFTPEITTYMSPKSPQKIEETIEFIQSSIQGNEAGSNFQAVVLKNWADQNLDYEYLLYPAVDENYASRRTPEFLGGQVFRESDEIMNGTERHLLEYRVFPPQK